MKTIELRANIIPRKIYANFLPIKAVSGSSFTLICFLIFLINLSPFKIKNFPSIIIYPNLNP